jgi:hypothetical protein
MGDLFHAIAAIPDAIVAFWNHPRWAIAAVLIGCLLAVVIPHGLIHAEPARADSVQAEMVKPERRITKIVKWLWDRE